MVGLSSRLGPAPVEMGGHPRTIPLLPSVSIPSTHKFALLSSSSHPSIQPSTVHPPSSDADLISTAVSILTEQRSRSRWNYLRSVCPPSGFSPAAAAGVLLGLRRRPRLALRFLLWTRRRDLPVLAAAAHVAARARLRSAALRLLSSAVRSHDPSSGDTLAAGCRPPEVFETLVKTYRAFDSAPFVFDLLIRAYLKAKRLDRAVQIARLLGSRGIRPLVPTSDALIRSVSRAKGSHAGFDIYKELFGSDDDGVRVRVPPKVGIFNTLLLALYREGRLEEGWEGIKREMERFCCEPSVFTYSIRMAGLCDEGRIPHARELFEEMRMKGVRPDVMAFNTLIKGYSEVGDMERAEELFREMVFSEIEPTCATHEHLIKGHCKIGDINSALLVHGDMRQRGFRPDILTVDVLIEGMCAKGNVQEGLGVLRDELRREGFSPSRKSYEMLIRGFCEKGEMEAAVKLQAEMAGKGFEAGVEVYSAFIKGYGKQGDTEMVSKLKDEMLEMGLHLQIKGG